MGWETVKKIRYPLMIGVLVLDQLVKAGARNGMEVGQSIPVIPDVFHLTYVQNTGAAFNLFEGQGLLLMGVTCLLLVLALVYMERHRERHGCLILALALIVSGGMGNLLDRFLHGYVTDLFDFRFFPVFNVADIAICVGCFFLILYVCLYDRREKE